MVTHRHKSAIENLYVDVCNVYQYKKVTDSKNKQTKTVRTLVHELLPCRISYGTFVRPSGDEVTSDLTLSAVLFLSPDVIIPAGSEIEVERTVMGTNTPRVIKLKNTSVPYFYATHQEITCAVLEDYA